MKKSLFCLGLLCAFASHATIPEQIYSLSEADRRDIFQKLMASEDRRCAKISNTFYQGSDTTGAAFWSVQCSGKAYQLMFKNDAKGSTTQLDCETAKLLGSSCFKRFK